MDAEIKKILELIKPKRIAKQMTQAQIANLWGVKDNTIARWEACQVQPKPDFLERVKVWLSQDETVSDAPLVKEILDHTDQMKRLLNSVEYELRYFSNGKAEVRDIFLK